MYWWKDELNIGDFLSYYVVNSLAVYEVKYKDVRKKVFFNLKFSTNLKTNIHRVIRLLKYENILLYIRNYLRYVNDGEYLSFYEKTCFAIGSILDFSSNSCLVWGSGFREYDSQIEGGHFYAVRGFLTLKRLNDLGIGLNKNIAIGDPALLLPLLYSPKTEKKRNFIIIPHFVDYLDVYTEYSNDYYILNVKTDNIENFVNAILESEFVISSSLHGLIIAHSYGIPALWFKKNYTQSSDFKFYDYFSSVGIEYYKPLVFEDISKGKLNSFFETETKRVLPQVDLKPIRKKLLRQFPYKLKSKYKDLIK